MTSVSGFVFGTGRNGIRPISGNKSTPDNRYGIVDRSAGGRHPRCVRSPPSTPRFVIRGVDETFVQHDVNNGVVMEISIWWRKTSFILEFSFGHEFSHRPPFALMYAAKYFDKRSLNRRRCSPLHFLLMNRRFLLLCADILAAGYVCAFLNTLRVVVCAHSF